MNFVLDIHCHTVSSGHAYSTLSECIGEAARKHLELLAITDHGSAMAGAPSPFHFGNMVVLPRHINGVEVLRGIELNILDYTGAIDLDERRLSMLDIVLASLHTPVIKPSTEAEHTEALIAVMNNPYVDILGHLGHLAYPFDIERVVDEARRTGTIIELNNSSFNPTSVRAGGDDVVKALARRCVEKSVPLVLGSDAHFHADVGNFRYLEPLIAELGIPEKLILNTSVKKLKSALERKRPRGY